jgi:mRNA interferase RelE/StbE
MANYQIEFRSSANRELSRLDRQVLRRVVAGIDALGDQPRPAGVRKLAGVDHTYRIRIGEYRVVYTIDDDRKMVSIDRVRHRSDAYR